jgi:hypothetical protein
VDEVYITKRRECSVLVKKTGCCGNQRNNDILISYSRANKKDTAINKNSGEARIFGFYNEVDIWEKLESQDK